LDRAGIKMRNLRHVGYVGATRVGRGPKGKDSHSSGAKERIMDDERGMQMYENVGVA